MLAFNFTNSIQADLKDLKEKFENCTQNEHTNQVDKQTNYSKEKMFDEIMIDKMFVKIFFDTSTYLA